MRCSCEAPGTSRRSTSITDRSSQTLWKSAIPTASSRTCSSGTLPAKPSPTPPSTVLQWPPRSSPSSACWEPGWWSKPAAAVPWPMTSRPATCSCPPRRSATRGRRNCEPGIRFVCAAPCVRRHTKDWGLLASHSCTITLSGPSVFCSPPAFEPGRVGRVGGAGVRRGGCGSAALLGELGRHPAGPRGQDAPPGFGLRGCFKAVAFPPAFRPRIEDGDAGG